MAGTLEREEFEKLLKKFVLFSLTVENDWQLKFFNDGTTDELYMEKKVIIPETVNITETSEDGTESEVYEELTFSTLIYHVMYSSSFNVPVLYFTAYHEDGKLFTLEEIWKRAPSCHKENLEDENKWSTITQVEHPKLETPFFMVHPCNTAKLMIPLIEHTNHYLVTWLSMTGPLAGLKLSVEYEQLSGKAESKESS